MIQGTTVLHSDAQLNVELVHERSLMQALH
jgi:hypothetical protein